MKTTDLATDLLGNQEPELQGSEFSRHTALIGGLLAILLIGVALFGYSPHLLSPPTGMAVLVQVLFLLPTVGLLFLAFSATQRVKSQERFIKAFRSAPDAIIISRLHDGRILEVNDRWEKMLGYRRRESIGKTVFDLNVYFSRADRQRLIGEIQPDTVLHDLELPLRAKSGAACQTVISASIAEIDGEKCLFLIIRDVTERKHAVEQERTRIAEDIHDDLGARLTEITLLSDLSKDHLENARQVRDDMDQIAARARLSTQSLDEIVWAVSPQQDSLESFINYFHAHASEVFELAGLRCRFELPSPPPIRPLASELRHNLFMAGKEILNNLVKHSGATEACLKIQLYDEHLHVIIADNGRGFVPVSSHIAATGAHGHNGLNNLCRRLESIGGTVTINSRPGVGTTIKLSVEMRRMDAPAHRKSFNPSQPRLVA